VASATFVSLFFCLKGKRLLPSTQKLVDMYSMLGGRHEWTLCQKVTGQGRMVIECSADVDLLRLSIGIYLATERLTNFLNNAYY